MVHAGSGVAGDTQVGVAKLPALREADVQANVTAFLELDGWRAIRTDPVSDRGRGKGFGEIGMADHLFLRYLGKPMAEVLWLEFKALGKKLKKHQAQWHVTEMARGAWVMTVDDFERFRKWYVNESGLNRRMLLR